MVSFLLLKVLKLEIILALGLIWGIIFIRRYLVKKSLLLHTIKTEQNSYEAYDEY